ncbi:hypothetical protein DFH27DRAFT_600175 [Peziza echinospora]|nr:hypothetical protein DFH27DRAFT_600175 [Peziza echinospora]
MSGFNHRMDNTINIDDTNFDSIELQHLFPKLNLIASSQSPAMGHDVHGSSDSMRAIEKEETPTPEHSEGESPPPPPSPTTLTTHHSPPSSSTGTRTRTPSPPSRASTISTKSTSSTSSSRSSYDPTLHRLRKHAFHDAISAPPGPRPSLAQPSDSYIDVHCSPLPPPPTPSIQKGKVVKFKPRDEDGQLTYKPATPSKLAVRSHPLPPSLSPKAHANVEYTSFGAPTFTNTTIPADDSEDSPSPPPPGSIPPHLSLSQSTEETCPPHLIALPRSSSPSPPQSLAIASYTSLPDLGISSLTLAIGRKIGSLMWYEEGGDGDGVGEKEKEKGDSTSSSEEEDGEEGLYLGDGRRFGRGWWQPGEGGMREVEVVICHGDYEGGDSGEEAVGEGGEEGKGKGRVEEGEIYNLVGAGRMRER